MHTWYRLYLGWVLLCFFNLAGAQTSTIDNLKDKLYQAREGKSRLQALLALCEEHHSLNRDTLDAYAAEARTLAQQYGDHRSRSLAELAYGNAYARWGWTDSTLATIEPVLQDNPVTDPASRDIYFKLARLKALSYGNRSRYPEALAILYQMIDEAERYRDTLTYGSTLNTLGSIAIARNQPREALTWIFRAHSFKKNEHYLPVLAAVYVNTAYAYMLTGKSDSASYYIRLSLPLCRKVQNLNTLATALRIQSNNDMNRGKYKEAEAALLEMTEVRRKINSASIIAEDNLQLSEFYANTGQLDKAIEVCRKNLLTGDTYLPANNPSITYNNSVPIRLMYYEALARYYKAGKNEEAYRETLEHIIAAKDSMYQLNTDQAIAELETKYQVQKKETVIVQQKLAILKRNYLFYGSLALMGLVLVAGLLIFRNYRRKQRLTMQLALEKEKQVSIQAINEAEENERRRIAADLHDNLGAQANALLYGTEQLRYQQEKDSPLLTNLHNTARDMLQSLRETVWAMKHTDVHTSDIWLRIINFNKHLGLIFRKVKINTEGSVPQDFVLSSANALHIILIVQESINNAVRHSKAQKITVQSSFDDSSWILLIKDDGIGFDMQEVVQRADGFGMINIQERARMAGIVLSINSRSGGGTGIQLVIPVGADISV